MPNHLDEATATLLFAEWGAWFGTPCIWFDGKPIDGRVRLKALTNAFKSRKAIIQALDVTARTTGDAVRLLCLAGHYDRVRELELIPAQLFTLSDLAAYCHCSPEIVAPLTTKNRVTAPRMAHHTIAARRRAIELIAHALRKAEQTTGQVSAAELRKALAPWL